MNTVLSEQDIENGRREFFANQCRSGTRELGDTLAAYGAHWWKDVELKLAPRNSDGFTFHVNGKLVEVATAGDTIVCKLHGYEERTLSYHRRTEPGKGCSLDDCVFARGLYSYSSGWYRGERYLQPGQVLRELIDTTIGNTKSQWFVRKNYDEWDLS